MEEVRMVSLNKIRIVDFATFLAGGGIATLLSDLGAEVIKVEPPDGDPWRNVPAGFMGVNRGKRGMAIDMKKKEAGEILSQGSLLAAKTLGKGLEQVPHFRGMDLPVKDPRSSMEFALSRGLFPMEWDYLQSLTNPAPFASASTKHQRNQTNGIPKQVLALEKRRMLADLNSLCPLVVARFPLLLDSDIKELFSAMTGREIDGQTITEAVERTLLGEKTLCQNSKAEEGIDPFPSRFFNDPKEKTLLEKEITDYEALKESDSL